MHVLWWLTILGALGGVARGEDFDADGCGRSFYNETIRRPTLARLGEFPWLARLGYQKSAEAVPEFHFHATLIHRYYAVTTVFAADYLRKSLTLVRLGDYHTSDVTDCQEFDGEEVCAPSPQDIPVLYVIKHPEHNRPRMANDLVLIKLQQPADLTTQYVQPICLPPPNLALTEEAPLFLAAWCGSVKSGISAVPRQYRMQLVSASSCAEKLSPHFSLDLHESEFCATLDLAKDANLPKDVSLRGSTGAPLQLLDRTGRHFQLVGITSVGVRNAPREAPYVFTNLLGGLGDWLRDTVEREEQKRAGSL